MAIGGSIPSLVDRREQLSRKFFTSLLQPSSSYPFTYYSGSYNYNSIKICKQISTPPQPYQKIPDIYFLRSCTLTNFISIPSPITIQFVMVALWNMAYHYIFMLWFVLFSSPNLSRRRLDVCHTSTHGVALVRI